MSSATKAARTYAEALADAAEAKGLLAAVAEELHAFAEMVRESSELAEVFASPALTPDDKRDVLEAVIERAAPMQLVADFLRVLHRNTRLHLVREIDEAFANEVDERTGVVTAGITTANPLTDEERATLERRLESLTGKRMRLTFATDEELIGGVVTRIGSKIYDGSIRAKLDALKEQMSGQVRA